ncbi:MAG TPA: decarboxylating 6-phosphogluconate dehydrogenase [Steroidobacteraceae bacterium]|nr:decarboxylating 6-phosphogluconate dehydrogenase [Steroidobacteraceae bacterium]
MRIGMIGLGRMGGNMTRRLVRGGHEVVAFAREASAVDALARDGALPAHSLEELIAKLPAPRTIWLMVPAGVATEDTLTALTKLAERDDLVVDGGNSYYKDSMRRAAALAAHGILWADCGTSGGIWGLKEGYSLMVGAAPAAAQRLEPILKTLAPAPDRGWAHVGPNGAGHFVKMVHNGVEYALMQAYAEGFELMERKSEFRLNLPQVAEVWQTGSVVRSWLLDLTAAALKENPSLAGIAPYVEDSGEGRWTATEGIDLGVALPTISLALFERFHSRKRDSFAYKLLAAMRNQFGGHAIRKE